MLHVCKTCKHYRQYQTRAQSGEIIDAGYCHASRNFAHKKPDDTCKRWAFIRELAESS